MWGGIIGLIIQLISGAVGGNIAGSALKQYNLGTLGNSIAGVIGGGVGAQIIGALVGGGTGAEAAGAGGLDIGSIIGQIVSGGVGGGILMVIVGLIKQAMGGQAASCAGCQRPFFCARLQPAPGAGGSSACSLSPAFDAER